MAVIIKQSKMNSVGKSPTEKSQKENTLVSAITEEDIDSSTINDNSSYHSTIGNYKVIDGKYLLRVNLANYCVVDKSIKK